MGQLEDHVRGGSELLLQQAHADQCRIRPGERAFNPQEPQLRGRGVRFPILKPFLNI